MFRPPSPPEIDEAAIPTTSANADAVNAPANNGKAFQSIHDRVRFKRNPNFTPTSAAHGAVKSAADRPPSRTRWHRTHRKGSFPCFRGAYLFYFILFVVFSFAMASMLLQSSMSGLVSKGWTGSSMDSSSSSDGLQLNSSIAGGLKFGSSLKFIPGTRLQRAVQGRGLDDLRLQTNRIGLRAPRLAVVLGSMKTSPQTLMLITVVRNLQRIGYDIKMYAMDNGKARSIWEKVVGQVSVLEHGDQVDWSIFEGVIIDSLEAKEAMSSLMQEPFCSIPLIWIIQEDTLANRLPEYEELGWRHLTFHWRKAFGRADVVVFPDFTLPMLYSVLDTGNFFVIPGSPVDVWSAERYGRDHAKNQLREDNGFGKDDLVVLVVGSPFYYNEPCWDSAVAMHTLEPLLVKYARRQDDEGSVKFVFLCGNSTEGESLQEVASRLKLSHGSVRHYRMNGDANSMLLVADIVLYGSSRDEQGFSPILIRAMTFEIPVIVPDIPIMKKYILDGVHGVFFSKNSPEALTRAFSLLILDGKLSEFARTVASSGRTLAKNMLALECITGYAKLLENVLSFPSDSLLPAHISHLQEKVWEWNLFETELEQETDALLVMDERDSSLRKASVVYSIEKELADLANSTNTPANGVEVWAPDLPSETDWNVSREIESLEDYDRLETEEIEERNDRDPGEWDDIYRNVRKSERLKFEDNERDEGELERTGQSVCIYEVYNGAGAWSFLHHGSLYRGLSLSTKARRSRSDDVDAVSRLPLLNYTYYQNMLCEIGGMFSIANKVDNVHRRPWIGFQSWRAAGKKVSLSIKAEKSLEAMIQKQNKDVMYFWARMDMYDGSSDELTFWSMCDIFNGGNCRTAFGDAFRQMYSLPAYMEVLPPMPVDGGHWSALHSWVMPTSSFLEFMMFSRMFVDSLDALQANSSQKKCILSSSELQEKHCYCRIMEVIVNVWAYHSGRKFVYVDPHTGSMEEQHRLDERKGTTWAKYFNLTLLKSMDEDLAEAADDGDHPRERWLWPLTGEVHWRGVYDREREEKYRIKMNKKRKTREKLHERLKNGREQKALGR